MDHQQSFIIDHLSTFFYCYYLWDKKQLLLWLLLQLLVWWLLWLLVWLLLQLLVQFKRWPQSCLLTWRHPRGTPGRWLRWGDPRAQPQPPPGQGSQGCHNLREKKLETHERTKMCLLWTESYVFSAVDPQRLLLRWTGDTDTVSETLTVCFLWFCLCPTK